MAFRDLLEGAHLHESPISVKHGVLDASYSSGHIPLSFEDIIECPGHRTAANVLVQSASRGVLHRPRELSHPRLGHDNPEDPIEVPAPRPRSCRTRRRPWTRGHPDTVAAQGRSREVPVRLIIIAHMGASGTHPSTGSS